ncbi:ATP-dependent DNA helicase PIF1-like [Tetranychus urticae]|uniref:ATP-dependent DNA helicase PIF1-like n=1 Tax=Tetranychus urticae TaxID=32264 RepID=UPI00077BD550|nr:ATP-dependent DNA helicase PIF1-like [Tetranychus urticae]
MDIPSENSSNAARRQGSDKAQSLEPIPKLARGCRVMLRYNLWTEAGIVNGALGTLTSILYESGQRPPTIPVALFIQFDNYRRPCYSDNSIPIVPITRHWKSDGNDCWRKQFPINVVHVVNIHKSQGLTLDKAVINIGETEKAMGSKAAIIAHL